MSRNPADYFDDILKTVYLTHAMEDAAKGIAFEESCATAKTIFYPLCPEQDAAFDEMYELIYTRCKTATQAGIFTRM